MKVNTKRREMASTVESLLLRGVKTLELSTPEARQCSQCKEVFGAFFATQHICDDCVEQGTRLSEAEYRAKRAEDRRHYLASLGLVGRLQEMTFDRFDRSVNPKAYDAARGFVAGWADPWHRGLALFGKKGTGKTHLACACAHALLKDGVSCRYAHVPTLGADLRSAEDWGAMMRTRVQPLRECDVLILDDIGREKITDSWAEALDALIDTRWVNGAPMILTANLTVEDFIAHVGEAAASRFLGDAVQVETDPTDRRMLPAQAVRPIKESHDPRVECGTCHGAGWVCDARLPVGSADRLMKCPTCSGAGW